jgi:hypothetical protein
MFKNYLAIALMHLVQANTRSFLPVIKRAHCKLGYFLIFWVGLYLPRSFTKDQLIPDFLAQIAQTLLAMKIVYPIFYFFAIYSTS